MRVRSMFIAVLSAVVLAACSSTPPPKSTSATPSGSAEGAGTSGYEGGGASTGQALTADERARKEAEQAGLVIYFDYDKDEIKSEYVPIVAAHAKYLNGSPLRKVRLEGHTDERGSREYNIGLGERRAQAVRRALSLQGVPDTQMTTVSYGEERPAVTGSDDAAYAKNRRVEIAY